MFACCPRARCERSGPGCRRQTRRTVSSGLNSTSSTAPACPRRTESGASSRGPRQSTNEMVVACRRNERPVGAEGRSEDAAAVREREHGLARRLARGGPFRRRWPSGRACPLGLKLASLTALSWRRTYELPPTPEVEDTRGAVGLGRDRESAARLLATLSEPRSVTVVAPTTPRQVFGARIPDPRRSRPRSRLRVSVRPGERLRNGEAPPRSGRPGQRREGPLSAWSVGSSDRGSRRRDVSGSG